MKKFNFLSNNDDECEKVFEGIKFVVFIIAVFLIITTLLGLSHWICPVLVWGFYFWNVHHYRIGCFSQVIDEYDDHERGYPHDGLVRMYKSWIVFAVMVFLAIGAVILIPLWL